VTSPRQSSHLPASPDAASTNSRNGWARAPAAAVTCCPVTNDPMITARQVRRRRLRVQQLLGATPGTGKSSPGRPIIEGEAHKLAETRSRCRAGSRRLRRRLVLVGGDPAPAGCWTGRHRRPEPADLAGPRRGAHPPHPGAAPSAGDPGWPFIRGHCHQPSRDRPARSGPGLHRRSRPPDAGEDHPALAARFPAPPPMPGLSTPQDSTRSPNTPS
jgi:hypothetical protein